MKYLKILSLALICLLSLNFDTNRPFILVIDAGHGGLDRGATKNGISEHEIVFSISEKIKNLENTEHIKVILLRQENDFMSLKDRVESINALQPDLVLSLHLDSNENKESYKKAYIYDNAHKAVSYNFAKNLLHQFGEEETSINQAGFYILKHSKAPSVNLHLGNLQNETDFRLLTSTSGQDQMAKDILQSIL